MAPPEFLDFFVKDGKFRGACVISVVNTGFGFVFEVDWLWRRSLFECWVKGGVFVRRWVNTGYGLVLIKSWCYLCKVDCFLHLSHICFVCFVLFGSFDSFFLAILIQTLLFDLIFSYCCLLGHIFSLYYYFFYYFEYSDLCIFFWILIYLFFFFDNID